MPLFKTFKLNSHEQAIALIGLNRVGWCFSFAKLLTVLVFALYQHEPDVLKYVSVRNTRKKKAAETRKGGASPFDCNVCFVCVLPPRAISEWAEIID